MLKESIYNKLSRGSYKVLVLDADNTIYRIENPKGLYDEVLAELDWCFDFELSELYDKLSHHIRENKREYFWILKPFWFSLVNFFSKFKCKDINVSINEIVNYIDECWGLFQRFLNSLSKHLKLTFIGENVEKLSKKFKLVILSEEERFLLERKLEITGIHKYFQVIISSSDTGYLKPHESYFEKLFEKVSESKDKILFIDDKKENIEFALDYIGIDAILSSEFEDYISKNQF